ncbi:MAG: hypothetical protein U0746_17290 [Gemmataceae bacterium]
MSDHIRIVTQRSIVLTLLFLIAIASLVVPALVLIDPIHRGISSPILFDSISFFSTLACVFVALYTVPLMLALLSMSWRPALESHGDLDHLLDLKQHGRIPLRTSRWRTRRVRPGRLATPANRPDRLAWNDDRE